ncbi:MAG: 4Fe-4S binding protein [Actinomycetota bacterium]|nr:4Fe-4S binding protein [Actinomycetota bacterium]
MAEPYVITSTCIDTKDKACVDVCPVQCIYELDEGQGVLTGRDAAEGEIVNTHPAHTDLRYLYGATMLYINPDECTSCDACLPECPVDAIYPADQVPADEAEFTDVNRFIFGDITA